MRKMKVLLTLLPVIVVWGLSAQTVTVKGRVTGPDRFPVKDAVITLTGAERSVQTNGEGEFEIEKKN